jgi:alpha-amylase/alpha-mannosidase (GH57 family)
MTRHLCVHGHFYQPQRENPWLEAIEVQDAAYPYHDWNERISAECYAPNGRSRILGADGRIEQIVNNYARISFNFGPTLLSWLELHGEDAYRAILEADRVSQRRFSGHGSAMAQVYNHMILPLANARDRRTQVLWGIADFRHRFARLPDGMWLPETAVDTESLEVLAEHGIRFSVLSPHQARRVRPLDAKDWRDVSGARIDPRVSYLARLPSGRSIALFFYDGPTSRAVAFEGLLSDGKRFADRLLSGFDLESESPQLVHIATDGESYGHHHRHGEMALSWALEHIDRDEDVQLTNYGEHLERFPPTHEVEIVEQSAWSCAHGVGRWWSDCGCNSGEHPGWNQRWRTPLRNALDWLRDWTLPRWEARARELFRDPWAARDDYVDVVLDRTPERRAAFLARHAARPLDGAGEVLAWKLCELQRHAMLMYTSCGWFFDELSGVETVQVMQYAGRAAQLAAEALGEDPEPELVRRLGEARSNIAVLGDGARIYARFVKPAMLDLEKVAAHYAISDLFDDASEPLRITAWSIERGERELFEAGRQRLLLGAGTVASTLTLESEAYEYGVLHFGDHGVQAGVRPAGRDGDLAGVAREARAALERGDFAEVIRALDRHFGGASYSLKTLFRDQQRRIVSRVLESTLEEVETRLRLIYEQHAPLLRFLGDLGMPAPPALQSAAEFAVNTSLRRAFEERPLDLEKIRALLDAARLERLALDTSGLAFVLGKGVEELARELAEEPQSLERLEALLSALQLVDELPFELNLWTVQNLFWELANGVYPEFRSRTDAAAREWTERFRELGDKLSVRVG